MKSNKNQDQIIIKKAKKLIEEGEFHAAVSRFFCFLDENNRKDGWNEYLVWVARKAMEFFERKNGTNDLFSSIFKTILSCHKNGFAEDKMYLKDLLNELPNFQELTAEEFAKRQEDNAFCLSTVLEAVGRSLLARGAHIQVGSVRLYLYQMYGSAAVSHLLTFYSPYKSQQKLKSVIKNKKNLVEKVLDFALPAKQQKLKDYYFKN